MRNLLLVQTGNYQTNTLRVTEIGLEEGHVEGVVVSAELLRIGLRIGGTVAERQLQVVVVGNGLLLIEYEGESVVLVTLRSGGEDQTNVQYLLRQVYEVVVTVRLVDIHCNIAIGVIVARSYDLRIAIGKMDITEELDLIGLGTGVSRNETLVIDQYTLAVIGLIHKVGAQRLRVGYDERLAVIGLYRDGRRADNCTIGYVRSILRLRLAAGRHHACEHANHQKCNFLHNFYRF